MAPPSSSRASATSTSTPSTSSCRGGSDETETPGARRTPRRDPSYTPTTTFETFPFPAGLTPNVPAASYAADSRALAIAEAARRLVELRDRWLNPPEWVEWVDEPVPGYPRRPVPRDEDAAKALKKRTLTNLYNARPQWLADAHVALDAAVAAAYGWPADIGGESTAMQDSSTTSPARVWEIEQSKPPPKGCRTGGSGSSCAPTWTAANVAANAAAAMRFLMATLQRSRR